MAEEKTDETTEMASPEEMQEVLDEATPPPVREGAVTNTLAKWDEVGEEETTPIPQTGLSLSPLRDRIAAGFVDCLALGYFYWGSLLGYNYLVWRQLLRPLPTQGKHTIIFHSLFFLTCFLYFFISEGVFFTSLGKFACRLSVRNILGGPAPLFAIAVRNILRPLDYLLLILPTWILLEKTPRRQRLGDLVAGTVIMKHYGRAPSRRIPTTNTASGTVRLISGAVDFAFAVAWMGGIALFIDNQRPIFSFLILLLTPVFYLAWHLTWETLCQTTIGLWIFGLQIVGENGDPIGFPQALVRAIVRLLDTNPLGWVTLFLSNKNQRPADLAAGCVVVYTKRSWSVLIGAGIALVAVAGVWFAGLANPRNYLTPFFRLDFLPKIFQIRVGGGPAIPASQGLFVKRFNYLLSDRTTPRPSSEFKPGDTILFSFDLTGFAVRNNEAWIQEDLVVRYPDNAIGFKQETIVDFHQMLKNPEIPLEILNTMSLPPNAAVGHYTLVMVLHDRFSDHHLTEQRTFVVTPP